MPRGGARPGAGRKAPDRPTEPLLTYSFTVRLTDVGVLNQLGRGNLSLGLRRLIDRHRAHIGAPATDHPGGVPSPGASPPGVQRTGDTEPIRGHEKGTT